MLHTRLHPLAETLIAVALAAAAIVALVSCAVDGPSAGVPQVPTGTTTTATTLRLVSSR